MTRLCICPGNFEITVELNKKQNQLTESSCNTCGGRFLVDGIGAISANMLSSVGLEVSNSINPELNWKKVTKGRRSRKTIGRSLNWGGKLKNQSPRRVGDFSGSDSDKFGEIASEQRAPEKVEHIPIKKRRHLLRSKSPSKIPFGLQEESVSPQSLATPTQSEELEMLYDHNNHSSGNLSSDSYSSSQLAALKFCNGIRDSVVGVKFTEVANDNKADFSGIALLAAAACSSNGIDDDSGTEKEGCLIKASSVQEKVDVSTSPFTVQTNLTMKNSRDQVEKDVTPESNGERPDSLRTLSVMPQGLYKDEEPREGMRAVSPKVDRLHWDLNTSMDAWEQPPADYVMGNAQNDGDGRQNEKLEIDIREETKVPEVCRHGFENFMHSAEMDTKISPSVLKTDGNMSRPVTCLNKTSVKEKLSDLDLRKVEPLGNTSIDKGIFAHVDDKDTSVANNSIHKSSTLLSEEASTVALVGVAIQGTRYARESIMGEPVCGTDSKRGYNEDYIRNCQLHDDKVLERKVTGTVISKILNVETSHSTSGEADNSHSLKVATVGDGQPLAGVKWQEQVTSASMAIGVDSQVQQCEPKELSSRCPDGCKTNEEELNFLQGPSKIFKEGPQRDDFARRSLKMRSFLEDCHKSDISHEDRGQTFGSEDKNGFQAGYDSPFEDGELRGSALCCWEENEVDGEEECVDYDSDGNGVYSDAGDHRGSEVVEAGSEGSQGSEKRVPSASGGLEADFSRSRSLKNLRVQSRRCDSDKIDIDIGVKKGSDAGFGTMVHHSADTSVEVNDVRKRHGFGFRWSYTEEFSLRTDRGKLQSRNEGPPFLDATDRKDTLLFQPRRPHSMGCSYTRPEREFSPEKFVGRYRSAFHVRDRNTGDGHWGSWDSRNRYPSIYHGPEGNGHPRRRSFADFGGLNSSRDQRQSINYSSKDMQRPPGFRRRLSIDRDDCYDGPRRMLPVKGGMMNRNSRGGGYSQKNTRGGFRQEGNLPLPDDGDVRMRHYLSRRDRTFSPSPGKSGHISMPRRKSRSRSRSSSPRAWHSQRDWNMSMRRQGRSPESRMERMRVPFKKCGGYVAEYGEGFVSPTRRHISPDRKSRWMDDQNNFVGNHFRRGRSPVRGMRRNQRFDLDRVKSDDYMRPMRRFPMMGGRVSKFDNNYNERGARHTGVGVGRRIGHEAADEAGNSQNNEDIQSSDQRGDDKRSFKIQQQ